MKTQDDELQSKVTIRLPSRNWERYSESTTLGNLKRDALASSVFEPDRFSRFLLHPESSFRLLWDLVITLLVFYQALAIPFFLAFRVTLSSFLKVVEVTTVGMFLLDMGVCMNTGFYANGQLVLNRKQILSNYFRLWFWCDLFSTFPFNWCIAGIRASDTSIESELSAKQFFSKLLSFAMVGRLVRLVRLKHLLMKMEDFLASTTMANVFVVIRLLSMLMCLAHWMACWWYYMGILEDSLRPSSWVSSVQSEKEVSTAELYVTALYWAFTTMTTVGYGDVYPLTTEERLFVTVTMIVSCGFFAYILGDIGSLVSKQNSESNAHRTRVVHLNLYMIRNKLPRDLQYRVRRFLEYTWEKQKRTTLHEADILSLVSEPLKDEIYTQVNGSMLLLWPMFREYPGKLVGEFSKALKEEHFAPGDSIFEEGQLAYKVYFVKEGKVDVYHAATGSSFAFLRKKRFFGEIGFFSNLPRCASAACLEYAQLLTLDRAQFHVILSKYPGSFALTFSLADKVRRGDLACIYVQCYICKKLGHIARTCQMTALSGNTDDLRAKWLNSRSERTRFICPEALRRPPNYSRKPKKPVKFQHFASSVVGQPRDLGIHSEKLGQLADKYRQTIEESKCKSPSTSDSSHPVFREVKSPDPKTAVPNVDSILLETESEEQEPNRPARELKFRRSLVVQMTPMQLITPGEAYRRYEVEESQGEEIRLVPQPHKAKASEDGSPTLEGFS